MIWLLLLQAQLPSVHFFSCTVFYFQFELQNTIVGCEPEHDEFEMKVLLFQFQTGFSIFIFLKIKKKLTLRERQGNLCELSIFGLHIVTSFSTSIHTMNSTQVGNDAHIS